MAGVTTDQLKRVIESQHGGNAAFRQSLRIVPNAKMAENWDGIVHVFDLKNNSKAKRAYAWSSSIKSGTRPRYFAVLHSSRVQGPAEAVRAAAAMIRDAKKTR